MVLLVHRLSKRTRIWWGEIESKNKVKLQWGNSCSSLNCWFWVPDSRKTSIVTSQSEGAIFFAKNEIHTMLYFMNFSLLNKIPTWIHRTDSIYVYVSLFVVNGSIWFLISTLRRYLRNTGNFSDIEMECKIFWTDIGISNSKDKIGDYLV